MFFCCSLPSVGYPHEADISWYLHPYLLWIHPVELISADIYSLTFCGYTLWSWYLQPYLLWVPLVELTSADIYSLTFCGYTLWSWYQLISTALPSVGTPCGADINSPEVAAVVCNSTDPTICYMSASTHIYVSVNKNSKSKLNSDTVKLSCSLRYSLTILLLQIFFFKHALFFHEDILITVTVLNH